MKAFDEKSVFKYIYWESIHIRKVKQRVINWFYFVKEKNINSRKVIKNQLSTESEKNALRH